VFPLNRRVIGNERQISVDLVQGRLFQISPSVDHLFVHLSSAKEEEEKERERRKETKEGAVSDDDGCLSHQDHGRDVVIFHGGRKSVVVKVPPDESAIRSENGLQH